MKSSRHHAVQLLLQVIKHGKRLDEKLLANADALTKEICYGVLRFYIQLQAIALLILDKPIKTKDQDIFLLILVGIYQLRFLNIPEHAAVHETVACCQALKKPWAKALVNSILRNYQRQNEFYLTETAHFSHPRWLVDKIRKSWQANWEVVLDCNNQHPPLTLRINQQRISAEEYVNRADVQSLEPKLIAGFASAVMIKPTTIANIPGFAQGLVSIQDAGAQFAANQLKLSQHQRVLDACAAPGGKTAHLLEREPTINLTAIDCNKDRLAKIQENLNRLKLTAHLIHQDANEVGKWWDGVHFDRILLDVPCSGSGVIRRHPDIKVLRRETDLIKFQQQQLTLLKSMWSTLAADGLLLYVTCSILPEENDQVIDAFCQQTSGVRVQTMTPVIGVATKFGQQLLPSPSHDGFYYCLLAKTEHNQ